MEEGIEGSRTGWLSSDGRTSGGGISEHEARFERCWSCCGAESQLCDVIWKMGPRLAGKKEDKVSDELGKGKFVQRGQTRMLQ